MEEVSKIKKLDFNDKKIDLRLIIGAGAIIIFGLISGYGLSRLAQAGESESGDISSVESEKLTQSGKIKKGQTYGEKSELFTDEATGTIERNTDDSIEGTHKLLREGGESQTAYLTSSLVDLDLFVNRKVKIWGETFAAQKVGWFMDVGAVKVLE